MQGGWEYGAKALLVPASSWRGFDLQAANLSDKVRAWATKAVRPYDTLLEAVRATLDPGV